MDRPKATPAGIVFAVLRIIAAVVCVLLLITFLFTISLGQANAGSVTGSIFCIAVILLVIFYPFIRKKKPLRIAAIAVGICLTAFALYCGIIAAFMASEIRNSEERMVAVSSTGAPTPQTVIVLGCKATNGEPSQMLKLRLDKAAEYLDSHPHAVCIVTGGQGGDESEPEAISMHRYLVTKGISSDIIYIEDRAKNTTENIKYSSEIIRSEGLSDNVVIITEGYHLYRSVRQAKLAGYDAVGISPDPSTVLVTMPSYWLREVFAVSRDIFLA